nr:MAG TPA: hypothetical protein [Caudoviricetes sp.]
MEIFSRKTEIFYRKTQKKTRKWKFSGFLCSKKIIRA